MSGRINTNAEMSAISEILEESSQLDTLSFHLLVDEYKKAIPTFAQLCQEYDLSLESCQTTGFTADLSFDEWAAYKHPVNSVTTYKKNTVEINNTGRTVTYLSAPLKQGNHINSYSYVRVNDEEDDPPTLGHIKMCFVHTFSDIATKFAIVQIYEGVQQDCETKLWWVPSNQERPKELLVRLSSLSVPLVTAKVKEENKLWFLTI